MKTIRIESRGIAPLIKEHTHIKKVTIFTPKTGAISSNGGVQGPLVSHGQGLGGSASSATILSSGTTTSGASVSSGTLADGNNGTIGANCSGDNCRIDGKAGGNNGAGSNAGTDGS